jgi:hypothetical protein
VPPAERRALRLAFGSAALRRTDAPWTFWQRFSRVRDGQPDAVRRLWNHFWRAFSIFYFFVAIRIARRARRPKDETWLRELSSLQERLGSDADFFAGSAPDTTDLQLFGLVQMCASIPGVPLSVLRESPELGRLREWVGAMQRRSAGYDHLYSAQHFEPRQPEIASAAPLERLAFWIGAAAMWLAIPVTLPAALYLMRRVRKKGLLRP